MQNLWLGIDGRSVRSSSLHRVWDCSVNILLRWTKMASQKEINASLVIKNLIKGLMLADNEVYIIPFKTTSTKLQNIHRIEDFPSETSSQKDYSSKKGLSLKWVRLIIWRRHYG